MPLIEELESNGNWLFRWRGFLPLALVGPLIMAMREYDYPGSTHFVHHIWEGFCLAVSFLGLAIRVLTVGHAPRHTSGRNTKCQIADSLNTTGLYSMVRNPLYLGNFFMGLGVALFPHIWWLTIIYALFFWIYYERIIFAEEAFLRKQFGEEYLAWARVTPVIVPSFRRYRKPSLIFSLKTVLRREYNGFFAVILAMFALEVAGDLLARGMLILDVAWTIAVSIGLAVWLLCRTLKKHSRVLKVEGRY